MEVLVHISGPGRVLDDQKYRKQAQGLQAFDGIKREHVHTLNKRARKPEEDAADSSSSKRQRGDDSGVRRSGVNIATGSSAVDNNEHYSQKSQDLSQRTKESTPSFDKGFQQHGPPSSEAGWFTSSLDSNTYCQIVRTRALTHPRTISTPTIASPKPTIVQVQRSASDSFETLPSVIPDSQPSQGGLKRAQCIEESQREESNSLGRRKRQRISPIREHSSSNARTPQNTIPSSSVEQGDERTPRPKAIPASRRTSSQTKSQNTPSEFSGKARRKLRSRRDTQATQEPNEYHSSEQSLRIIFPRAQAIGTPPNWQVSHTFCPPVPSVTLGDFTTHITPFLKDFIDKELSLARRYKPLSTLRPLDPLERGRWEFLLPAETLDAKKRQKFLREMKEHTEKGKPGWGTWFQILVHASDPDETVGDSTAERRDQRVERLEQDWIIRAWCWGEVVGHIYLLLFLLTATKIKGLGAVWIDCEGEVVVQMQ